MNLTTKHGHWAATTVSDARWSPVVVRDSQADGTFYYSVETTGVYCRLCAANALAVVILCHRVVRKDGGLSSYRWGVERQRALLEKEAHACMHR